MKIPMSSPDLTEADRQAVMDVMNTPILSLGPKVVEFEKKVAEYIGVKHAIAVNSGTAGLHLTVRAAGITAEDRVVTSPFSFVASTNALLFENAVPIYVDVDYKTGNISVDQLRQAVKDIATGGEKAKKWLPRKNAGEGMLKAILPVDVFGQPADYDPILEIAEQYHLEIIEDSCEALGATYKGKKAGLFGKYGIFAFYPNKQITTGEGGIVITNDDTAANLMKALRNQGRAPGDTWLSHTYLGYNYRLDEMSSALGISQITRVDSMIACREQVAKWYLEQLAGVAEIELPILAPETTRMSWFVFVIRLAKKIDRQQFASNLEAKGVPVRPYFLPIHLQPYMVEKFGYQPGDYPVTEDLGLRGVALPFSGVMTFEQVQYVCDVLKQELAR